MNKKVFLDLFIAQACLVELEKLLSRGKKTSTQIISSILQILIGMFLLITNFSLIIHINHHISIITNWNLQFSRLRIYERYIVCKDSPSLFVEYHSMITRRVKN